jgi:hypothetical protein
MARSLVAIGYDYFLESGPNFTSVLLSRVGDNQFDLYIWNGTEWMFDSAVLCPSKIKRPDVKSQSNVWL